MKKLCAPLCILLLVSCAGNIENNRPSVSEMEKMVQSDTEDLTDFREHIRYYVIDRDLETAWKAYTDVSLEKYWQGPMATFSSMFNPSVGELYAAGDPNIPSVSEGQIIKLNLLIDDYIRIPVYFQIRIIDAEDKVIEFVYMEQNTSHGKQVISFSSFEKNGVSRTLVRHQSWFKSGSSFRDALFYGHYHTLTVDEFHQSATDNAGYTVEPVTERYLKKKGITDQA